MVSIVNRHSKIMKAHPTKLLLVCSKNRRRSYTAEKMFDKSTHYHVRSRGTEKGSRIKLTSTDINWADMIFTMEKRHVDRIREQYSQESQSKRIVCLFIKDVYEALCRSCYYEKTNNA